MGSIRKYHVHMFMNLEELVLDTVVTWQPRGLGSLWSRLDSHLCISINFPVEVVRVGFCPGFNWAPY